MKVLFTILILLTTYISFSQTKLDDLKEMQASKMYVFTYDTTDAESSYYCTAFNQNLHTVFSSKRWDFCKVEYIQVDKIEDLMKSNPEAFLLIPLEVEFKNDPNIVSFNKRSSISGLMLNLGRAKYYTVRKPLFKKNKFVYFKNSIHNAYMSSFDIVSMLMGIDYMQQSFNKGLLTKEELKQKKELEKSKEKISKVERLKTKTLYIEKSQLKDLSESSIKSLYHFPFKIVSSDELINAIKNKSDDVSFIQIKQGALNQNKDALMVFEADTFDYLAIVNVEVGHYIIDKKDFEKLNKIAEKE